MPRNTVHHSHVCHQGALCGVTIFRLPNNKTDAMWSRVTLQSIKYSMAWFPGRHGRQITPYSIPVFRCQPCEAVCPDGLIIWLFILLFNWFVWIEKKKTVSHKFCICFFQHLIEVICFPWWVKYSNPMRHAIYGCTITWNGHFIVTSQVSFPLDLAWHVYLLGIPPNEVFCVWTALQHEFVKRNIRGLKVDTLYQKVIFATAKFNHIS